MKQLMLVAFSLLLSGCNLVPESLRVNDDSQLLPFSQAKAQHAQTVGELARWGGVIAKVENKSNFTIIEVVNFALKSSAKPEIKDETLGRFLVVYQELLDPIIYKTGREITALGTVAPAQDGKIGEHEYIYPVLEASAVHLWPEQKTEIMQLRHDPFWYAPSYWRFYPYPVYPRTVIIHKGKENKSSATSSVKQ